MNNNETVTAEKLLFYRIVALWAVCEGMLGGIIHSFNLPGTGLLVSSGSVICICLLASYFPARGTIIKATVIVAIFKLMLSPYSPPTAYIAVFFQGLMGELLFINKKNFRLSSILLAALSLVESAIQRILVLTLIYGSTFWKAANQFISKLTSSKHITNYSWYIAIAYVLLHLIVGIFIGRFASALSIKLNAENKTDVVDEIYLAETIPANEKKRKGKYTLLIVWLVLFAFYIQSEFKMGKPMLPSSDILQIIIRSILIVCLWYFIFSPLLSIWLKRWLRNKQFKMKEDVEAIVGIIPSTRQMIIYSWKNTADAKGYKRFGAFAKLAITATIRR